MSESGRAVFLSYASQDSEAAKRIADALRAAGVEVWFDQSELRGGDAWDQSIRRQIKECALFVPVITPNTNARAEGYFRLEWKLAVDRSHLMADDAPFLFPIVVGDVTDATARVPEKFRDVQWTRLRLDETPAELGARVAKLLRGDDRVESSARADDRRSRKNSHWIGKLGMIVGLTISLIYALRPILSNNSRRAAPKPAAVAPATPVVSEARQLTARARATSLDKYDSSAEDFAAAETLVKRALELDPNDAEIWAFSSLLNFSFGSRGFDHAPARVAAARSHAERALSLDPNSSEAQFALARWQRDNEEPAVAEASFKKIIVREPNHIGALSGLAWIYDQTNRVDESAALSERIATLPGSNPALSRYTEFLLFFHRARFEEADRCIRLSIATQPSANSLAGHANLLLTWKGDVDGAAKVLASMPTAARSLPRTIWMTALVQLCQRAPAEVLQTLDRFSGDFVQDNFFAGPKNYWVGRAHALAGRKEAARLAWETALDVVNARLKNTGQNQELHLMRGELLALLGQTDEALREARTVEELARGRLASYWFWSPLIIYAALGRADDALPLLEKFCVVAPVEQNVGWPLTPALLRLDPKWDKIRDDPRFQKLCAEPAAAAGKSPAATSPARELADKALALLYGLDVTREDLALAEDMCQRALKLDSGDGEVWAVSSHVNAAYVYRGWDASPARREQTRVAGERAIRLAPKSVEARLAQAGAWSTFNINRAETEKLLREVLQDQPDNQVALRFLAVTVLGRGDLEETLALNERSAALPGGDPLALYNNARYLLQRNRQEEAYATIQRSLAQKPFSSALVFKTLMEIYTRGDLPAAEATSRLIPTAVLLEDRANFITGLLSYYQRNAEAALKTWSAFPRDAYEDFQFDGPKGLLVGFAYELDGREAAAKIEWRAALLVADRRLAAASNNPRRHYDRAYLLACLGDKEAPEALRTYEQLAGVKLGPGVPLGIDLALVYARLGRLDELLAHWPAAFVVRLRLDPRFDVLRKDRRFDALLKEPEAKK